MKALLLSFENFREIGCPREELGAKGLTMNIIIQITVLSLAGVASAFALEVQRVGEDAISKRELVHVLSKDAQDAIEQQSLIGYAVDYLKGWIPGYNEYRLRGLVHNVPVYSGLLGDNLREQTRALLRLPYAEYKERLMTIHNELKVNNPQADLKFLSAVLGQSSLEEAATNTFSLLSLAAPILLALYSLSRVLVRWHNRRIDEKERDNVMPSSEEEREPDPNRKPQVPAGMCRPERLDISPKELRAITADVEPWGWFSEQGVTELKRGYCFTHLGGPGTKTKIELRCRLDVENDRSIKPFIYLVVDPSILTQTKLVAVFFCPSDDPLNYPILSAKIDAATPGVNFIVFDIRDGEQLFQVLMLGKQITLRLIDQGEGLIAYVPLENDATFAMAYDELREKLSREEEFWS